MNLSAESGWEAGKLLLDPLSITIVETGADIAGDGSNNDIENADDLADAENDFPGAMSFITSGAIESLLDEGPDQTPGEDVTLAAVESITINSNIGDNFSFFDDLGNLTFVTQELYVNAEIDFLVDATFIPNDNSLPVIVEINADSFIDSILGSTVDDTFTIASNVFLSTSGGSGLDAGTGDDTLTLSTGSSLFGATVNMGAGNDTVIVNEGADLSADVFTGIGNDIVRILGGGSTISIEEDYTSIDSLNTGEDDDNIFIAGTILNFVEGIEPIPIATGTGNDTFTLDTGGTFLGSLDMGADNDTVIVNEGGNLIATITGGEGNDEVQILGGNSANTFFEGINTEGGNDSIFLTGILSAAESDLEIDFEGGTVSFFVINPISTSINTGSGDDTIDFFEAATLIGSVNGGDRIDLGDEIFLESGFDTLNFTESSEISSIVDTGPGSASSGSGSGLSERMGTTDPTSVITNGYDNINEILLPSTETPTNVTETIATNDQERTSTSGLGECFTINCIPNMIFLPTPIDDALIEQLVKIGIYARNNTEEETLERLMGSSRFVQQVTTDRPKPNDFQVATGRTEKDRIVSILDHYTNLVSGGIDNIQQTLKQTFQQYSQQSDNVTGSGLRAYIEQNQESEPSSQALYYLNGYRELFTKIETSGLTPKEIEISKSVILRTIRVPGLSSKELREAISQPEGGISPSDLGDGVIQLTFSN